MTTSRRFEDKLYEYYQSIGQYFRGQPIILGGVAGPSGGIGGPPGGLIGYLPQTRVAYDTSEAASPNTPASGASLLDNLNHIRWQIATISGGVPASGTALSVKDDGSPIATGVTVLNFTNELTATNAGGGQVDVTFVGNLETLDNVDTAGKSGGQVLTWNSGTSKWTASGVAAVPSGGVVNIDDLADVSTAGKSKGEVLTWNGASLWVPSGIPPTVSGVTYLDNLLDVNTTGKSDGQVLTWKSSASIWVASGIPAVPSGGVVNLDDLGDVNTAGKSSGQILTWDGASTWVASGIVPGSGGGAAYLDNLLDVDTTGKTDGQVLTWDNDTTTWVASGISQSASSGPVVVQSQHIITLDSTIDGSTVGVLPMRLYAFDVAGTIKEVLCAVNTVPASSGVRINVRKNGATILNSPFYIEIPVGSGYAVATTVAASGFVKNDYFQVEVVREDSAAADLSVHIRYYWETS